MPKANIDELIAKALRIVGLPEDQWDDFMSWAFGDDWQFEPGTYELLRRWNTRHREFIRLLPHDRVVESMVGMVKLYARDTKYTPKPKTKTNKDRACGWICKILKKIRNKPIEEYLPAEDDFVP